MGMKPRDSTLTTQLLEAIQRGTTSTLKSLIPAGWNLDQRLGEMTALGEACSYHRAAMVKELLALGADVNHPTNEDREPPIMVAVWRGSQGDAGGAVLRLLIQEGADVNASDVNGETPLIRAAETGPFPGWAFFAGKCLIDAGADPNAKAKHAWSGTALHVASITIATDLVKLLLAHGADPNVYNKQGFAPIHKLLVEVSADEDEEGVQNDWSVAGPLMTGNLRALLDAGADVNALTKEGRSPLQLACERLGTPEEAIAILVEAGAELNIEFEMGDRLLTPLAIVALFRDAPALKLAKNMIGRGADLTTRLPSLNNLPLVLILAAMQPTLAVVALERDPSLHTLVGEDGSTFLMLATKGRSVELVKRLLDLGCDAKAVHPEKGKTALDIALANEDVDLIALLEQRC